MSTAAGCAWSATASAGHISFTQGSTGTGPGTIRYGVSANSAPASRSGTITVAGQTTTIIQSGSAPLLQVSPSPLAFGFREGGPPPADQFLNIFTNAQTLAFSTSVTASGGNWLSVGTANGAAPVSIIASVNPSNLAPGTYRGTITVTAQAANPSSQAVPVTLTIESEGPPKLSLESGALTFSYAEGSQAKTVRRAVANLGGGLLEFQAGANTNSGGSWLRVSPDRGETRLAQAASLVVTADPQGLPPGTHTGRVSVTAGADRIDLPVTMSISASRQTILLSQTGLSFTAVAQGGAPPPQSFGILNTGEGVMDWSVSASTTAGENWLSATPNSGSTDAASLNVPLVDVSVSAAGLAPGEYHGQLRVAGGAADNSPQFVSVILSVLPLGSDPGPIVRPTGLIFTGAAGGAQAPAQTVRVSNLTGNPKNFASGRLTTDGAAWFTSAPAGGTVAPGQPVSIQVSTDNTGLPAGIRRGVLTLLFADGGVRTVNLLFVLGAGGGPAAQGIRAANGDCTPTRLLPLITSLGSEFNVPAAWPNPVDARVVDDCGNAMTEGSVVATFSNGDPPLPLISLKDGRWTRTWQARRSDVSQVKITVSAEARDRNLQGQAELLGSLRPNPEPPVLASGGVLNGASFALGAPLSPGSMISIFGQKLSQGEGRSPRLPLETQLAGALAVIGGRPVPLIIATEGQINAVVPYGLQPNTQHHVVVQKGNSYTVPEAVTVAAAQPAIFSKDGTGRGQGIIVQSDGRLAEPGSPAAPGASIVLYCTGLGEVSPAVEAGRPAPADPLSRVNSEVKLSIGGVDAPVAFAGLVPGFTGFYQVNATVPEGVTAGGAAPVILTVAGQPSPVVTIAVQ